MTTNATVLDLDRDGAGAGQNAQLAWETAGSLLSLNQSLLNLVLDLGDGDDQVVLSEEADGRLRLSGDSIYDLVFAKPTNILGLVGGRGLDRVVIGQANLGDASLYVEAELIGLGAGARVETGGDLVLRAQSSRVETSRGNDIDIELRASVQLDGTVIAAGDVVLEAFVKTDARIDASSVAVDSTLASDTEALVLIGGDAHVTAHGLSVSAITDNRLEIRSSGGLGSIALSAIQRTEAGVAGGAELVIGAAETGASVLIEAIDRSTLTTSLKTADTLVTSLSGGFDLGFGSIDLDRTTLAYLGDGGGLVTLGASANAATGLVHVGAANVDGAAGGITGEVVSGLLGVHSTTVNDVAQASVQQTELTAAALEVYALNAVTHSASGKVARHTANATTTALIVDANLHTAASVDVLALDRAAFTAESAGFSADVPLLNNVKLGIAAASNTIDRSVSAGVVDSTVDAGALMVIAGSRQTVGAITESLAVTGGGEEAAAGMSLALGGTFAWNQLLGAVQASIEGGSVATHDAGDVRVEAANASAVTSTKS